MSKWSLEVYDGSGNRIADITRHCTGRGLVQSRNRSDIISFSCDIDEIKRLAISIGSNVFDIFAVNENEVRLKRNNVVVSAGQIVQATSTINTDQRTILINALGWFDLLGTRYTDQLVAFSQVDQGDIAWQLIDATQQRDNGDFGITQGNIQTSILRDRTYNFKNIKNAITELSEVQGGFDFEITWDKVFNVYYPGIGTQRDDIAFTYPGNIATLSFDRIGLEMANEVISLGAGSGGDALFAIDDDTTSQAQYGLRQSSIQASDVIEYDNLLTKAQAEISLYSSFLAIPTVTLKNSQSLSFSDYKVGDIIPIKTNDQDVFGAINDYYKVEVKTLKLGENDEEDVTVGLVR